MARPRLPSSKPRSGSPGGSPYLYERRIGRDAFADGLGALVVSSRLAFDAYLDAAIATFQRARPRSFVEIPPFERPPAEVLFVANHFLGRYRIVETVYRPLLSAERVESNDVELLRAVVRGYDQLRQVLPPAVLQAVVTEPPLEVYREMLGLALEAELLSREVLNLRLAALPMPEVVLEQRLQACRDLLEGFNTPIRRKRGHPINGADRVFLSLVVTKCVDEGRAIPTRTDLADLHGTFVEGHSREGERQRWRDRYRALARTKVSD